MIVFLGRRKKEKVVTPDLATLCRMIKRFLLILFPIVSYGQFQPNSIGVVYVTSETYDVYNLEIVFPIHALEKSNSNSSWEGTDQ